ncbi:MAG TPA: DUF3515 family protein [Micromonosporaceae bacterium]|nr:DUF3515 family protein [Micromonosporaceae bacterium]
MPGQPTRDARRIATLAAIPVALLVGLAVFAAQGGFAREDTGPVTMAAPALGPRAAALCRALLAELPGSLRDRKRRPVTAGAEQNAAYGDPPITLGCAAGPAPSIAPETMVYGLSGVCWVAQLNSRGSVWTTVDREVPVTVTVPEAYSEPGQWVIEFSGPLVAAIPSISAPPGCRG